MDPLRGLFENDAILMDLNRWLINSLADKSKDNEKVRAIYEGIKTMLITVIPNLYDIREKQWEGSQELLYYEEDLDGLQLEDGVIFDRLSSGLKSMISMLGDMMIRLFDMQPEATEPSELCGIVLIDEIDIHLHPNWQRKLPELLDEYFPLIQFIITTHSPIPLLGAPEGSRIFVIKRVSTLGVTAERLDTKIHFENLLPNSLLTSPIFDLSEIIPDTNKNLNNLRTEDTYQELNENDEVRKKLRAIAKKIRDEKD
jgi:predicted ATP-binding protein involved in virulence